MKTKSKELYHNKLLSKYWQHWCVYKLSSAKNRLNDNLAFHYREQSLTRKMFNALVISNKVFSQIYSEDRVHSIWKETLFFKCFDRLKTFTKLNKIHLQDLPKKLGFYFYADLWFENQPKYFGKKFLALEEHKVSKIREYYMLRAFFSLQDNYEVTK